ncbi:MAG: MBL fold metallo-hydrolase [Firmicutes bacterium]|nr:MBL fold metallo-hydrolase [Bacillota bacterium]
MIIPKDNGYYENFQGHDRFDVPEPIYRVTGGQGGESYLIVGSEKTALFDCGMACWNRELISNIHEILDPLGKTLDYVLMSHTHYDHIGALPYLIKEWPEVKVCGAEKAVKVFTSEPALKTMRELGDNAADLYGADSGPVTTDGLRIDIVLKDGDVTDLGDIRAVFYESKGHTDCSASYMIEPMKVLFLSESVGQYEGPGRMDISVLKSFRQSFETAERMSALGAKRIVSMHYGFIPEYYNDKYFEEYINEAKWERELIVKCIKKGFSDDEISDIHDIFYWEEGLRAAHPYDAYHMNTMITIKLVRKEMEEEDGKL